MIIYKYPIPVQESFTLNLPKDAKVLYVDVQGVWPQMWVAFNLEFEDELEVRLFHLCGTGHDRPTIKIDSHIGSFQQGPYVWHVFEG